MDPRLAVLDDWKAALQEVLGALSAGFGGDGHALDAVRARTERCFARFCALDQELGSSAYPYPDDVRAEVEAVLRLESIAVSLAASTHEALALERGRLVRAKGLLRDARGATAAGTGRSCDVRG